MPKLLTQTLAVEKTTAGKAFRVLADAHKTAQKPALFAGLARSYAPLNENDPDTLPDETTLVQVRAEELLRDTLGEVGEWFDLVATKDHGNTRAQADVIVDGDVIINDAPVTLLLFLEKRLIDLRTFVSVLPTLPVSEDWKFDGAQGIYRTEPTVKNRTKKTPYNHVRAPATDKHPAQVDVLFEDVPIGRWTAVAFSGALQATRAKALLDRLDKLIKAVKVAREEANTLEVEPVRIAQPILDYLLDS